MIAYAAIALELFITIVNGVTQAVTYQFGHRKVAPATVYAAMVRIVTAVSVPSAIILAAIALTVPSQRPLLAVALALPFAMYAQATTGILLAGQRIQWTNVQASIANAGFNLLAIGAVVLLRADARIVLGVWVATYVATAAYAWLGARSIVRGPAAVDRATIREQAVFAIKAGSAQVAGFINMRIDVVIVSLMLGARALGVYTLAIGTAEMLWLLSQPLCFAAFGRIAAAPAGESAFFTAKLTRHIVALVVPLAVLGAFVAPSLIGVVYGSAFAAAGRTIQWLLPGVAAYSIEIPLGYFLMVKLGRPGLIVVIQLVSVAVCACVTFLTVRSWGIDGAAVATSVTYVGVVVTKATIFMRATGVGPRQLLLLRANEARDLVDRFGRGRGPSGKVVEST